MRETPNEVRKHIDYFPFLNMNEQYCERCSDKNLNPVKIHTYGTFNTEYNVNFYKHMKDQCDLCVSYKYAMPTQKVKLRTRV